MTADADLGIPVGRYTDTWLNVSRSRPAVPVVVCQECGAVVVDDTAHDRFHAALPPNGGWSRLLNGQTSSIHVPLDDGSEP